VGEDSWAVRAHRWDGLIALGGIVVADRLLGDPTTLGCPAVFDAVLLE
jgi:hypothetical protein